MQIVVLDGCAINPGDLDWRDLHTLGHCIIFDRTSPQKLLSHGGRAQIVLTNKVALNAESINSMPFLRYIGVLATGSNVVDVKAAAARDIVVSNVPQYGATSVAQATMSLLLELSNAVGAHNRSVHTGHWSRSRDYCYSLQPLIELHGLTLGLIGYGGVGQAVAKLAAAFGMNVIVHTRTPQRQAKGSAVEFCGMEDLLRRSDVVSLHCPLTPQTANLIDRNTIALMKPTAWLINTSRGPIINEVALADALNTGRLAGAAVDVLSTEPPDRNNPLLSAKNCVITPHIAWATGSARARLLETAIANVRAFMEGRPRNIVKP